MAVYTVQFIPSRGSVTAIHPNGATTSTATGINPEGDLVGFYTVGTVTQGFLATPR